MRNEQTRRISVGNTEGERSLEDLGIDERNRLYGRGLCSIGLEWYSVFGSCEYDSEPTSSVEGGDFLHFLSDYQLP